MSFLLYYGGSFSRVWVLQLDRVMGFSGRFGSNHCYGLMTISKNR